MSQRDRKSQGTYEVDISRLGFDASDHFSAVRMQQGRVLLDSDWNDQIAIRDYRRRLARYDLVGPAGVPAADPGFEIRPDACLECDGSSHYVTISVAAGSGEDRGEERIEIAAETSYGRGAEVGSDRGPGTLLARYGRGVGADGFQPEMSLSITPSGEIVVLAGAGDRRREWRAGAVVQAGARHRFALVRSGSSLVLELDGDVVLSAEIDPPKGKRDTLWFLGAVLLDGSPHRALPCRLRSLRWWGDSDLPAAGVAAPGDDGDREDGDREDGDREDGDREDGDREDGRAPLLGDWRFDQRPDDLVLADSAGHEHPARCGGGQSQHAPAYRADGLEIGAGRLYVEGMLCELDRSVPFDHQPDLPGEEPPALDQPGSYLFYLDAWERTVTASQDPSIAEVALHGADTTGRSQVLSQVRWMRLASTVEIEDRREVRRHFAERVALRRHHGRMKARWVPVSADAGNQLYRVQVRSSGWPVGGTGHQGVTQVSAVEVEAKLAAKTSVDASKTADDDGADELAVILRLAPSDLRESWRLGDQVEMLAAKERVVGEVVGIDGDTELDGEEPGDEDGRAEAGSDAPIVLRVRCFVLPEVAKKIHGVRRAATFVWSRDNGSVTLPVRRMEKDAAHVELERVSWKELSLEVGDWVEIVDRRAAMRPGGGASLHQITSVDQADGMVALDPPPSYGGPNAVTGSVILRRWDQQRSEPQDIQGADVGNIVPSVLRGGAVIAHADAWVPLELGLQVQFANELLHAGDYWWIPSRTAIQGIEWPEDANGKALLQSPVGILHRYAPLAGLRIEADGHFYLRDYRKSFEPAVDGAVRKQGDTMYGDLRVEADVFVEGQVRAKYLGGRLISPDAVGTENLRPHSVTHDKVAADVGTVPVGFSILAGSAEEHEGYEFTGSRFMVFDDEEPAWQTENVDLHVSGPIRSAVVGDWLYLVFESGEVFCRRIKEAGQSRLVQAPSLPSARRGFAVASAGGRLYCVGGVTSGRRTDSVLVLEPGADSWESGPPLSRPRADLAVAALDGELIAVGGQESTWTGSRVSRRTEILESASGKWRRGRPMPRARFQLAAAGAAGRVYCLGGYGRPILDRFGCNSSATVQSYHPATDSWRHGLAPLPSPRVDCGAAPVNDRIYVAGGTSLIGPLKEAVEYDPAVDAWRMRRDLPHSAPDAGVASLDGLLLVAAQSPEGTLAIYSSQIASRWFVHRRLDVPPCD